MKRYFFNYNFDVHFSMWMLIKKWEKTVLLLKINTFNLRGGRELENNEQEEDVEWSGYLGVFHKKIP